MKHIAIVDCSVTKTAHHCYNRLVKNFGKTLTYHSPSLLGNLSLEEDNNASGYIIFGSYSNVSEFLPWQVELSNIMKQHILNKTPVFGICFGHQLMAHAFGGIISENKVHEYIQVRGLFVRKEFLEK